MSPGEMEHIRAAAVRVRGRIYQGASHRVAVWAAGLALDEFAHVLWEEIAAEQQGFVTSKGRFVSRVEALRIAMRAGQVGRRRVKVPGVVDELHSEEIVTYVPRRQGPGGVA